MLSNDTKLINFQSKFYSLQTKTKQFSEIDPRLFLEDREYISVFRMITGTTTHQFSKLISLSYAYIYNLEHGKGKLKIKGATNLANKILSILRKTDYSYNLEDVKRNYCSLNSIILVSDVKSSMDSLDNFSYGQFKELCYKINLVVPNHLIIYSAILEDSRIIVIFRILLGYSQRDFAEKLNISKMTVEELENGYRKIKLPSTAKEYAKRIEKLYNQGLNLDNLEERWLAWKKTRKSPESKLFNLKPIRYLNVKDFVSYIKEIRTITNDFYSIDPELFQKSPQLILIFRILVGMTQRDLERALKFKGRYVSNYETMKYKTLSRGMAELFSNYFQFHINTKKLYKLTNEEIINKFLQIKDSMSNHGSTVHKLSIFTDQEKGILNILNNIKLKDFEVFSHYDLDTMTGKINLDFVLKKNNIPIIAIECTNSMAISKKFNYNIKRKVSEIDYRFIKIKNKYKNIKTFLILSTFEDEFLEYKLKKFINSETMAISNSFINNDLLTLQEAIQEALK